MNATSRRRLKRQPLLRPAATTVLWLLCVSGVAAQGQRQPGATGRWMELHRVAPVTESLWLQEGGRVEYVRHNEDRVLLFHRGLLPGSLFRKLLGDIEVAAAEDVAIACNASLHHAAGAQDFELECSPGDEGIAAQLFQLAVTLPAPTAEGAFLRLGAAQPDPPPGASDGVQGGRLGERLRRGRFVFLDEQVAREVERFPLDSSGGRWVNDLQGWRPVLLYAYEAEN